MTLYLDIDGVLNGHQQQSNGYCGTDPHCVAQLNRILHEFPGLQLVISSAWRYLISNGSMTVTGFECLLLTHGVDCHTRVWGCTDADARFLPANPAANDYAALSVRSRLIQAHAAENGIDRYVVLDDLPLPMPQLIRTDGAQGLTERDADRVIFALTHQ